ncbi:MAG TPA: DUF6585 family protein [Anaerolineales bacterium]|nr:DUF6585 family protein [Anaerolineales bacterium]
MSSLIPDLSTAEFGSLLGEHRLRPDLRLRWASIAVISVVGAVGTLAVGTWRWYFVTTHFGPSMTLRWIAPALFAALGFTAVAVFAALSLTRLGRLQVQAFDGGLVIRRGRNERQIPWAMIQSIRTRSTSYGLLGLTWGSHLEAIVQLRDGRRLRWTQALRDLATLIQTIKHRTYPGLIVEYDQRIGQGHAIQFGPLQLTQEGLRKGRSFLPREQLGEAALQRGHLTIHPIQGKGRARMRIPASRVPNAELCLRLLRELGKPS